MRKEQIEEFRPEITVGTFGGGDVWYWLMPNGQRLVNGVVANMSIEENVAKYVKNLAEFHQRTFSIEEVKLPKIIPATPATPAPVAVPLRENKIREKAEAKPRPAKRAPVSQPIQVGYGSRVHDANCILLRDHIGECESASVLLPKKVGIGPSDPPQHKSVLPPTVDLPPIKIEAAPDPIPPSVKLPTPHKDVLPSVPNVAEKIAGMMETAIAPKAHKDVIPAKQEVALAEVTMPFFDVPQRNPFYPKVLAAVALSFADTKASDTLDTELLRDEMNNELCELVPAMNLWNRAGLLADEVVAEFNKDRNYITSQEGPVLWKIVQTKVNLLLTELRADTELRVKRAREGN